MKKILHLSICIPFIPRGQKPALVEIFPRLQLLPVIILLISCSVRPEQKIVILATTDVHGVILPYDFIEKRDLNASLAHISAYVKKTRMENKTLLLLDGGDNLQGQPEVYYYNFIDTLSPHINAEAMNFLGYDACTAGNHDIEAGHSVYDRIVKEYDFPMLAANAIDKMTGEPYFRPYAIIERNGLRIAVFGLITPAVPTWLPPELYSGIEFRDMVETAKLWMPVMRKEKPDLIVGLFHSGWDERDLEDNDPGSSYENGSASVAWEVPGFDIIFNGHDHSVVNRKFVNSSGDTVLALDGGSRSEKIARADVVFFPGRSGSTRGKSITGDIVNVDHFRADPAFTKEFAEQEKLINNYVNKVIATSEGDISSRDSYFGSSAFVDMIHKIQLEITGADISFAAPLSFDVKISSGPVTVGDMFKLYRFENMLYTMSMTGEEIRKYLEFSYADWLNTMKGPNDMLLKFRLDKTGKPALTNGKAWLKNLPYNFDSAAGIDYVVDASKPEGERVLIKTFSNGDPFGKNETYSVAVNSYRGNGGGGHFTDGAGIKKEDLVNRLISSTEKDLRYYILKSLESEEVIKPQALNNWKIIPAEWVAKAKLREYRLLFGR